MPRLPWTSKSAMDRRQRDRYQRAAPRCRHQAATDFVLSHDRQHCLVQLGILCLQRRSRRQRRCENLFQHRLPTHSSRTRASKLLRVTVPIFSPNPRKLPRMLNSTSSNLPARLKPNALTTIPRPRRKMTRAPGSLLIFASFIILPLASGHYSI